MAGYPQDQVTINNRIGSLVLSLRDTLDDITHVKAWLDTKTDTDLANLGFTPNEVAVIKSAFTDLNNLYLVAHGQATQAAASDFFFFAKQLLGLN